MIKTAFIKCISYEKDLLKTKIEQGLNLINFPLSNFKNKRVGLKPNLLMSALPEKAIVTHPVFFEAIAEIVIDNGGKPILIESPAVEPLKRVLRNSGYDDIIQNLNIEIADDSIDEKLSYETSGKYKSFQINKAFFNIDILINIPKLKSHGLTFLTCACKNLFGLVNGLEKARWHMKASSIEEFSSFILDLNEALLNGTEIKFLHILDSILCLEGKGPATSGTPRQADIIALSENPLAIDLAVMKIIQQNISNTPTVSEAFSRKLGIKSESEIEFTGHDINSLTLKNFKTAVPSGFIALLKKWPFNTKFCRNLFIEKPVPSESNCTLCYQCRKICPAKAIHRAKPNKNIPFYDYKKCIRCYCCIEVCPEKAIDLKKGSLQWAMGK